MCPNKHSHTFAFYLHVAGASGWHRRASFKLTLVNQRDPASNITRGELLSAMCTAEQTMLTPVAVILVLTAGQVALTSASGRSVVVPFVVRVGGYAGTSWSRYAACHYILAAAVYLYVHLGQRSEEVSCACKGCPHLHGAAAGSWLQLVYSAGLHSGCAQWLTCG